MRVTEMWKWPHTVICAVTEGSLEVLGGQKEPLTSLKVSAEVVLELKFEGYVFCQVKREEEHVSRHSRAVWYMALRGQSYGGGEGCTAAQ